MSIFHKLKYFSLFEARNCVSDSSFEWLKNKNKEFTSQWVKIIDVKYNLLWIDLWKAFGKAGFSLPPVLVYSTSGASSMVFLSMSLTAS